MISLIATNTKLARLKFEAVLMGSDMTYNEFVRQPLALRRKILHKIEDVRLKESVCMKSTTSIGERTQTSFSNTTEISYTRYIDAKNELDQYMDVLEQVQGEVRLFLYDNLPPDDADALEWKYIDGKSPQEIADIIGVTYDAMRAKLSRADKKARKSYNSSQMSQIVT